MLKKSDGHSIEEISTDKIVETWLFVINKIIIYNCKNKIYDRHLGTVNIRLVVVKRKIICL